ncbi:MAG: GNAT family N-acetyltransferase [Spirosomataceae bacterium]|jgi:GNAT superfamily N-acetyltransferase
MDYLTEPLDSTHNKSTFSSGKDMLDNYFWKQASQDVKRRLAACFVAIDKESKEILGYYTLSSNSISNDSIPDFFRKNLPTSYYSIPTILLGRLAIDKNFQGKGFGAMLLIDALKRCFDISDSVGAFAIIVDPLDAAAEQFYLKYGFIKLPDSGKMFLPMKTVKGLFV